ncbi:MAG: MFS transporter [Candidatus Bathyarchaeota archaeon]|nr:MFS transporter [Candidatus Bathyarchaeota archaeon]
MDGPRKSQGVNLNVILLSLAIFLTDASHSTVIPIFPSFAQSVGASLSVLGAYGSASGIAMLLLSIPIGRLSDRYGRRRMMIPGLVLFILVPLFYTLTTTPLHLYPIRILLGVGIGLIFGNGFLLMTEIATSSGRSRAQGIYMTAMGLGFTVGPLIGGFTAKLYGTTASFMVSSGLAFLSLALLLFVKEDKVIETSQDNKKFRLREVIGNHRILASGVANFLNSIMFNAMTLFFPVYGSNIGLDEAEIGIGLTTRGLASTIVRLPVGTFTKYIKALNLMVFGLILSAGTIITLSNTDTLILISALMGIQGVAYGIYLTSGNIYVAETAPRQGKGTAMGVYSMFGNISSIVNPLILGLIAENLGTQGALQFSAGVTLIGVALIYMLINRGSTNLAADNLEGL